MAGGTWDKLEQVFEDRVARALSKLGVHTQSDVSDLPQRVDELSEAVNKLDQGVGRARRRASRESGGQARAQAPRQARRRARRSARRSGEGRGSAAAPQVARTWLRRACRGRVPRLASLVAVELVDLLDVVLIASSLLMPLSLDQASYFAPPTKSKPPGRSPLTSPSVACL